MAIFNSNIPQSYNKLKDSQNDIQKNFEAIKEVFGRNHVELTGLGGDEGKHKWITHTDQDEAPITSDSEFAVFNKTIRQTGVRRPTLFIRRPNNGDIIPLTKASGVGRNERFEPKDRRDTDQITTSYQNYMFFPNGLLVKYGQEAYYGKITDMVEKDIDLTQNGPDFTTIGHAYISKSSVAPVFIGTVNYNIQIRYDTTTVQKLVVVIKNLQSLFDLVPPTFVSYFVIGTADLSEPI